MKKTLVIIISVLMICFITSNILSFAIPTSIEIPLDIDSELNLQLNVEGETRYILKVTPRDLGYFYEDEMYVNNVKKYNETDNTFIRALNYFTNSLYNPRNTINLNKLKQSKDYDKIIEGYNLDPEKIEVDYNWGTNKISYDPPKNGYKFSLCRQPILKTIEDIKIDTEIVEPFYDFTNEKELSVLGQAKTHYTGSIDLSRNKNMRTAINKINKIVVNPGATFSMYKTLEPFTQEEGYEKAGVIQGDKYTQAFGGGVCQIATTLYNAVLKSELQIVERHNHSTAVGYVYPGFDATVAGEYVDFKFQNNKDTPVVIFMYIGEGDVRAVIVGEEVRDRERKIKFDSIYNEQTSSYELYKTITTLEREQKLLINTSKYKNK